MELAYLDSIQPSKKNSGSCDGVKETLHRHVTPQVP